MKMKLAWLTLLACLPAVLYAVSERDFAFAADIQLENNKPFYEMEIPAVVYEHINRPDLGDMRVLNAAGEVVPHGLRQAKPEEIHHKAEQPVPFFALYRQPDGVADDLHINIQRDAEGEVIDISSSRPSEGGTEQLSGYLLDMSKWESPVSELKIGWKTVESNNFIRRLNVLASEDMESWRSLASGLTLVDLSYQGHKLRDNIIETGSISAKYLKLVFSDNKPGLLIDNIIASHSQSSKQDAKNWQQVAVQTTDKAGEYLFAHQSKQLLRGLRVGLPQNNTVVRVQALSRDDPEQPWRLRGSRVLYRLSVDGIDIEQKQMPITPSRDTNWLLRVDQKGGGLGSGLPVVEHASHTQNLVFVARGEPPYRLVWGSARVQPVTLNANELLGYTKGDTTKDLQILGKAHWIENSARPIDLEMLAPTPESINWRKWILWSVLVVAALLLVVMAVRLMKRMSQEE